MKELREKLRAMPIMAESKQSDVPVFPYKENKDPTDETEKIYTDFSMMSKLSEKEQYSRLKGKFKPVAITVNKDIYSSAASSAGFPDNKELLTNGKRVTSRGK